MTRYLFLALLLLTAVGCDHQVGVETLPQGRTSVSSGLTANLRAVFAVSDQEVYAVGEGGTVARYDGGALTPIAVEGVTADDLLTDVAAADTGEVVAIGGTPQETPLLLTLHDGAWAVQPEVDGNTNFYPQRLYSTLHQGFESPRRVVLAGGLLEDGYLTGYASSYADGAFTPVALPSEYALLEDVTAIGATLYFRHIQGILAVNAGGTDLPSAPNEVSSNLVALADGRESYLFGFAGDGSFYTFHDDVWSESQTDVMNVAALDGRAVNDLYAVGANGGFFHFDGMAWTALDSGTTENRRDLHGLPNGHGDVVGEHGTFFVYVP
jgi:hypothetical protein